MYLAPEGDEIEIADAAATMLADVMPVDRLHQPGSADMDAAMRQSLGDMGWFSLALPESSGGSGLSAVEHALFFREVGRQCGPIDALAQALAVNACQSDDLRSALAEGSRGCVLLIPDNDAFRLIGSSDADYALLVERGSATICSLESARAEIRPALDPANSLRVLTTQPDPVEKSDDHRIWQLGELGTAAMLIGIAEAALDLIVEYAKVRETFGRAIGSYQAVRHPCADMAVRVEAARAQLWYAAAAIKERREDAQAHLDTAKHLANETAMGNTDWNIQLHGGIGVTDEHNAHLLHKHTMLLTRLFGTKRVLLKRVLDASLVD